MIIFLFPVESVSVFRIVTSLPAGQTKKYALVPGIKKYMFFFYKPSRSSPRPTQPPIQSVPLSLTSEIKRLGRETNHSQPSIVEVENVLSCNSIPPYAFKACTGKKLSLHFTVNWPVSGQAKVSQTGYHEGQKTVRLAARIQDRRETARPQETGWKRPQSTVVGEIYIFQET